MNIEIKLLSNGVWRVRIGLIEENFVLVETALEWLKEKMIEANDSWINGMQNTVGT